MGIDNRYTTSPWSPMSSFDLYGYGTSPLRRFTQTSGPSVSQLLRCFVVGSGISVGPFFPLHRLHPRPSPLPTSSDEHTLIPVRVETEHLGNADAYRVTREIPLPYRKVDHDSDDDENDRVLNSKSFSVRLARLRKDLTGINDRGGRGPDELNVGPRGHARQREYEARRPGDSESPEEGQV